MWEREIEKEFTATSAGRKNITGQDNMQGWEGIPRGNNNTSTLGFRPGCACDLPPIPATILDPFAGSGTTLLVAKRMGLNAIGLDLSHQYLRENAWERVGMSQPVMV
jgi:hypothetical protein